MTERTFGGRTLAELKKLRKHPPDGANFYLALLDAAPVLFQLAEDYETLETFVQTLVEKIEKTADPSTGDNQRAVALEALNESLNDPAIRKIIASR